MNANYYPQAARMISLLLLCAIFIGILPFDARSVGSCLAFEREVSAKAAFLMEAEDRLCLYEKNADTRLGEASTTKIMTALVVSEELPLDKVVAVPDEAVGVEGSSVYLSAGELLSVRELLLALLLESANDAAVALAIATAGSLPAFAELMNEKATELGLKDTHFTNPHGLYDEQHYTTARELAIITAEALNSDELREIFATKSATIPLGAKKDSDEREGKRYLRNHNKMLSLYEGAIGVKTGFTKKTGRCLVSAAERDGMTLICVTLSAPDDWNDHTALLDHGFGSYSRVTLYEKGELRIPYALTGGSEQYVTATNSEPLTMTLPKGFEIDQAALNSEFPHHFEFAPVEAGALLGRVTVSLEGRQISSPLVAAYGVPSAKRREHKRFIFF